MGEDKECSLGRNLGEEQPKNQKTQKMEESM